MFESSFAYTPQQNGVVERIHRHILEDARALMFEAGLPIRFWRECVMATTYRINKLPSTAIGNKTPYEVLFAQNHMYHHMHVFGYLPYVRNNKTTGDKLEIRGKPSVFIGYPQGQKEYRVNDLVDKKFDVSRDVVFVKDNFPFKNLNLEIFKGSKATVEDDSLMFEQEDDVLDSSPRYETQPQEDSQLEEVKDTQLEKVSSNELPQNEMYTDQEKAEHHENVVTVRERSDRVKSRPRYLDDFVTQLPPLDRPFATCCHSKLNNGTSPC